ncbi:MAG: nucleotidyltransferase domain-containing protein [Lachnospiraceae bacterium]|nr:nucleotidyltransferase domain-containing protein [Lachnospiraceae bacterium]MBQ8947856.1 nucleotidyltransferase domain-containing protein [Lachnospiraceae bacterium]
MTFDQIMTEISHICRDQGVAGLYLFGSYATGTYTDTSDIDIIVKGCTDMGALRERLSSIRTLKKIDVFDYDAITNKHLKEAIDRDGLQIY